jgi:hypothetical protein
MMPYFHSEIFLYVIIYIYLYFVSHQLPLVLNVSAELYILAGFLFFYLVPFYIPSVRIKVLY